MELLALAFVNLLTAAVMYILFSLRFSRAVEQTRKNQLFKELRENIELAVEYINTSLDAIDQRTASFYKLVRRAEEIARSLEQSTTRRPRKKKATASKSRTPVAEKAPTDAGDHQRSKKSTPSTSQEVVGESVGEEAGTESSAYLDRVLRSMAEDSLSLEPTAESSEEAYLGGRLTRASAVDQPATGAAGLTVIGSFFRRLLGAGGDSFSTNLPSQAKAPSVSVPDAREASGGRAAPSVPETETAPPANNRTGARFVVPDLDQLQKRLKPEPARGDRLELSAINPQFSGQPRLPLDDGEAVDPVALSRELSARAARQEANEAAAPPRDKRDLIRTLLASGYRPAEISSSTGISIAEIELVASLPGASRRPRRARLTGGA